LKIDYNDGRNVLTFVDRLRQAVLPSDAIVGGGFIFMADIVRLVRDEAPKVVVVVAALVALVLVPFLFARPWRILLVVSTVGIVAIVAQSSLLGLGIKINMLNFAAVPITIGIGADYVVNLLGAMDAFKLDARRACVRMGGAILLCSLTTVVGYLSLVLAESGALRSFGLAAVFGEIMAVTTVLLVLPVLMPSRESALPTATEQELEQV
jgi:predicted RND superfamily exporter protein